MSEFSLGVSANTGSALQIQVSYAGNKNTPPPSVTKGGTLIAKYISGSKKGELAFSQYISFPWRNASSRYITFPVAQNYLDSSLEVTFNVPSQNINISPKPVLVTVFGTTNDSVVLGEADPGTYSLSGLSNISLTGNSKNNTLTGNLGNNIIEGKGGRDVLTGLGGKDTFKYSSAIDSLFGNPDRIMDFTVGEDKISGFFSGKVSNVSCLINPNVAGNYANTWGKLGSSLQPNAAVIFNIQNQGIVQTFVVVNDNISGFNFNGDLAIEITGFRGTLNNASVQNILA